jgi:carboxypeptidase C (cathepsin A)
MKSGIGRWTGRLLAAALATACWPAGTTAAQQAEAPAATPAPVMRIPPLGPSAMMWRLDPTTPHAAIAPRRFVSHKTGVFAGQRMAYDVVAEDQLLHNTAGETTGSIFSFSYLKTPAGPAAERPVLFIFNGGPGSSSLWLHMGVLGPRKADFRDVDPRQVPPFGLADNPDSVLAAADLVFIDPIGTGFSRYWGKGTANDFYGSEEDAAATVQFINAWLRKHHRWGSPKFLLGESYGTTRANLVSRRLMGGFLDGTLKGVSLNGVILVGGDGGLATPRGNDRFLVTFTTQAATAWYHGKVDKAGRSFDQFIAEADRFAHQELVPALNAWDTLDPAVRAAVAHRYASFTGLSDAFVLSKNMRIVASDYDDALLADRGLVLGHYDSRYTLPKANSLGDPVADDAAMGQYSAPFIGAFNTYIRDELGIAIDDDYVVIDWVNVNMPWHYAKAPDKGGPFAASTGDPGGDLAAMMRRNPDLYLMTAEGWYDMFGAVGSAQYGVAQRHLPADRVVEHAYQSGHMAYVGTAGLQFAADVKTFIRRACQGRPQ